MAYEDDWVLGDLVAPDNYAMPNEQQAAQMRAALAGNAANPAEVMGSIGAPVARQAVETLKEPFRKGAGLMQRVMDANAEMFPAQSGITSVSTDYDPRREAADYAAGAGFNVVAGGMGVAPEGALGMAGGRLRPEKATGFAPGSIAKLSPEDEVTAALYGGLHGPDAAPGNWIVRYSPDGTPRLIDAGSGHHGFSAVRSGKPVEDMTYKINNPPAFNRNVWDIADREGDTMIFGVKDRSRAGGQLAEVGGRKLRKPVQMEGGADYSLLHEGTPIPGMPDEARLLYANQQGPANKIIREAREAAEQGSTPLLTLMTMGKGAGDSARQTANTAYRLVKQARPDADLIEAIDKSMASEMKQLKGAPAMAYPGFGHKDMEKWIDAVGGNYRGALVRSLDKAKLRDMSGVDIGEVRYANTDPRFANTPTGSAGRFMGEINPELGVTPHSFHSNYPTGFMTTAAPGGLVGSVPFKTLAPDLWRGLMKAGEPKYFADNPMTYIMGEMPGGIGKSQKITPEVVDKVSEFFRRNPQGWAVGGGAVMGGLAANDHVKHKERPDAFY